MIAPDALTEDSAKWTVLQAKELDLGTAPGKAGKQCVAALFKQSDSRCQELEVSLPGATDLSAITDIVLWVRRGPRTKIEGGVVSSRMFLFDAKKRYATYEPDTHFANEWRRISVPLDMFAPQQGFDMRQVKRFRIYMWMSRFPYEIQVDGLAFVRGRWIEIANGRVSESPGTPGPNAWPCRGAAKTALDSKECHRGPNSLRVELGDHRHGDVLMARLATLQPQTYYRWDVWMKHRGRNSMYLTVGAVGQQPFAEQKATQGRGWRRTQLVFKTPDDARVRLALCTGWSDARRKSMIWIDDMVLEPLLDSSGKAIEEHVLSGWRPLGGWYANAPLAADGKGIFWCPVRLFDELPPAWESVELRKNGQPLPRKEHLEALDASPGWVAFPAKRRLFVSAFDRDAVYTAHYRPGGPTSEATARARGDVERARVPLSIEEPAGQSWSKHVVSTGVPFPLGHLAHADSVRVVDAAGKPVPCQTRVLNEWPDGSVRWLLVEFPVSLAAKAKAQFALEYGNSVAPPKPASPMRVEETDETVTVTTGPMRLLLGKTSPKLLDKVWLDADANGRFDDAELLIAQGIRHQVAVREMDSANVITSPNATKTVVVEDRGPLRCSIRVSGQHTNDDGTPLLAYDARIHACANSSRLKTFFTFTNVSPKVCPQTSSYSERNEYSHLFVHEVSLGGDLVGSNAAVVGGDKGDVVGKQVGLYQVREDAFDVTVDGGAPETRAERAPGWADLSGARGGLTIAARNFWQLFPKSLEVGGGRWRVGLWPAQAREPFRATQGMAKRHELLLEFHPGAYAGNGPTLHAQAQRPLMAIAPTKWYCDSRGFGCIVAAADSPFPRWEEGEKRNAETVHLQNAIPGMRDYGDWYMGPGKGGRAWGDLEYDLAHAYFMAFVRGGDRRFFDAAERAVRHFMDIDTVHFSTLPGRSGVICCHSPEHTGFFGGGGHGWLHSFFEYYCLTGDRRALEVGRGMADFTARAKARMQRVTSERETGWPLAALAYAYEHTLDEGCWQAMRQTCWAAANSQDAERGCWIHDWGRETKLKFSCSWMTGILTAGLRMAHMLAGDAETADAIATAVRWQLREAWRPERVGFQNRLFWGPMEPVNAGVLFAKRKMNVYSGGIMNLIAPGLCYAYDLTGDKCMLDVALRCVERVGPYHGGKGHAQLAFHVPYIYWSLARCGPLMGVVADQPVVVLLREDKQDRSFRIAIRRTARGGASEAKLQVIAPNGRAARSQMLPKDGARWQLDVPHDGQTGIYTVRIDDQGKSGWDVTSTLSKAVVKVDGSQRIAKGVAAPRFFLNVPKRCDSFSVRLRAGEASAVRACVRDPGGRVAAHGSWNDASWHTLSVKALSDKRGKAWSFEYEAGADMEVALEGVPAFYSAFRDRLFETTMPTASAGPARVLIAAGSSRAAFDARESHDVDGQIVEYRWDFGDGATGRGAKAEHEYREAGVYTVGLTVRDNDGNESATMTYVCVPPHGLLAAKPEDVVLVHAESFDAQDGGTARRFVRAGTHGEIITKWFTPRHWVQWHFDVKRAGRYHVYCRFACGSESSGRKMTIDGATPQAALGSISFPVTGGWGAEAGQWQFLQVADANGDPAVVPLRRGGRCLRLTCLHSGLALDFVAFVRIE